MSFYLRPRQVEYKGDDGKYHFTNVISDKSYQEIVIMKTQISTWYDQIQTAKTAAATSATAAATSATNAKTAETNAKTSETNASKSATAAATSAANAKTSETTVTTAVANLLPRVLDASDYGTTLPSNPVKGRIFFKIPT